MLGFQMGFKVIKKEKKTEITLKICDMKTNFTISDYKIGSNFDARISKLILYV